MKLSVINERFKFIQCPNCGHNILSPTSKATCHRCRSEFRERGHADQHSGDGLRPPHIRFSNRYGGKFANRSSGITTTPHAKMGE